MTYVKYAKREATDYIDWGAIGKGMVDMLNEENKIREEKKAQIDESLRQDIVKLNDSPQSGFQSLNSKVLDLADSGKNTMLMYSRLLKSGQLSTKDYLRNTQNLMDGTDQFYAVAKTIGELYDKKMERMKSGVSGGTEKWAMEVTEQFTKLDKMKPYVNPTTGVLSLAMLDDNGEMTDEFLTIQAIANMANTDYDKYDVQKGIAAGVAGIDEEYWKNWAYMNAKERKGYDEYKNTWIDSIFTNPYSTLSVLVDYVGGYSPTKDKNDTDPTKVQMVFNESTGIYEPKFTDKQIEAAKNALSNAFDQQIQVKRKEVIDRTPKPPGGRDSGKDNKVVIGDLLDIFTSSDPTVVRSRLVGVGSTGEYQGEKIEWMRRTSDGKISVKVKGKTAPISEDLNNMSEYEAAKYFARLFYGIEDVDEALLASGYTKEYIEQMKTRKSVGKFDPVVGEDGKIKTDKDGNPVYEDVFVDLTDEEEPEEEEKEEKEEKPSSIEEGKKYIESLTTESLLEGATDFDAIHLALKRNLADIATGVQKKTPALGKNTIIVKVGDNKFEFDYEGDLESEVKTLKKWLTGTDNLQNLIKTGIIKTGTESGGKKRTIAQIMSEDNVDRAEAIKIFNAQ